MDWKEEIIQALKSGEVVHFGCNARNAEVMEFMGGLQKAGLITTRDMGLSQETRLEAKWTLPEPPQEKADE